ncbi:MAG: hypothetical protein JWO36_1572 [Myxococcales bacterium]|nr:hypothetical protein [Myxococcales bacterium]
MKIRTMLGLGLIGTAIYAHKQRGGEMTIDSFKQSLNDLWLAIQNKASDARGRAEQFADRAQDKMKDVAGKAKSAAKDVGATAQDKAKDVASTTRGFADDASGYGSSGYPPGGGMGNGTNRR